MQDFSRMEIRSKFSCCASSLAARSCRSSDSTRSNAERRCAVKAPITSCSACASVITLCCPFMLFLSDVYCQPDHQLQPLAFAMEGSVSDIPVGENLGHYGLPAVHSAPCVHGGALRICGERHNAYIGEQDIFERSQLRGFAVHCNRAPLIFAALKGETAFAEIAPRYQRMKVIAERRIG